MKQRQFVPTWTSHNDFSKAILDPESQSVLNVFRLVIHTKVIKERGVAILVQLREGRLEVGDAETMPFREFG